MRALRLGLAFLLLLLVSIAAFDYFTVASPVRSKLGQDARNEGIRIRAHPQYYVMPGTLILSLRAAPSVSSVDIWRSFFQVADTLAARGNKYREVRLNRGSTTVYMIDGEKFLTIGKEFGSGQNPLYLLRTLPEKFVDASGARVFPDASQSLFGVGTDLENATAAAAAWAGVEKSKKSTAPPVQRVRDNSVL